MRMRLFVAAVAMLSAACSSPLAPTPPPQPEPPVVVAPPPAAPAPSAPVPVPVPPVPPPPAPAPPSDEDEDERPTPPPQPAPVPPTAPDALEVWTITLTDASPGFQLSGTVQLRISAGWRANLGHLKGGVIFRSPTTVRVDLFENGGAHAAELVLVHREDGSWYVVFNGRVGMAHGTAVLQ